MTRAEHAEALLDATRGSVADYMAAVLAAVRADHHDLVSIADLCWAQRVLMLADAVLLFHTNVDEPIDLAKWKDITGEEDATAESFCDFARKASGVKR